MAEESHSAGGKSRRAAVVAVAVMLGAMAMAGYWAWTYSGVYRWLAEMQLKWFGSYEVQITFLAAFGAVAFPALGVMALWRKIAGKRDGKTAETADGGKAEPKKDGAPADGAGAWLARRFGIGAIVGMLGIFLLGMGAYEWWKANRSAELVEVAAARFEAGNVPAATWVAVRGIAKLQEASTVESSNSGTQCYVPVVSQGWKTGQGVGVYLEVGTAAAGNELRQRGEGKFTGMMTLGGLPGVAVTDFEGRGMGPAKNYRVIDWGRTPADSRRVSRDMFIFGGAAMGIGAVLVVGQMWWAGRRRQQAREVASRPPVERYAVKILAGGDSGNGDLAGNRGDDRGPET